MQRKEKDEGEETNPFAGAERMEVAVEGLANLGFLLSDT